MSEPNRGASAFSPMTLLSSPPVFLVDSSPNCGPLAFVDHVQAAEPMWYWQEIKTREDGRG
jgi:hypothetical protein